MVWYQSRMRVVEELRGFANAVGTAANKAFAESDTQEADEYEYCAGVLGAFTLGSAAATYKFVETGSPITGTKPLVGLAATILLSVGSMVFYDKSREARQDQE